jgi:hypothetical protein
MKSSLPFVSLLGLLLAVDGASAQVGVAGRVGTLGIGAEAAISLSDRIVIRGGLGLSQLEANTTFDGVSVVLTLPESWYNVGIDLYLNGSFRIGGGILFKPDDPTITGAFEDEVEIGGRTFTSAEIGILTGQVLSEDRAPYVLIGFGKHTSSGIGLSLDVGAAFLGNPSVTLAAEGGTFPDQAELDARLELEAQAFEEDMKAYLKIWPILSLGIRIGIG